MDFYAVLDQVLVLLRQRGRVSYRALKRQFDLDDAYLDDLKMEILEIHECAVEQDGTMLVWTGDATSAAALAPVQAQTPLASMPPYLAEKILTSRSALEGERKQVTVLFTDLKGSMELLADRDPEEARQLLDPVLERMMAAVHRYEGTVNQVMGDGIMALFGAPIAHEDHTIRACYAALAMQATIRTYAEEVRRTHGITVQMRVGLNAGEVVVRTIGNDLHMDYSAVGQTTHLAARMEQLATPGSILLTAETLRLVEGLVQIQALGPIPVKGLPEPVEVCELVGASTLRSRFQAQVAGGLTRFVGRDTEMATLHQILARAGTGHGQVVALVGEAGMGKSRLVYEFVDLHRTKGWRVLESASVSYGKATPYFSVIDLLRRYWHLEERDDARTVRAKVTGQVLTLAEALQEALPALLSLLEVLPDDSPFRTLDPRRRRQHTLDALKRVFLRESQGQPLLLVFEDVHWSDAETQAVLDSLVESVPAVRILLLVTYRPEYQHGWGSKTYYTQLRLDPLLPASADALLQALLGNDPSLTPLKRLLIERTAGNPFFLEECVRTLGETGVLVGESGAYRLGTDLPAIHVPATVQAVLAARIDRLPPEEKRLLQTAAVIGTEVPLPLLRAIAEQPEDPMYRGLAHLQAAEFLYETRLFPELEYTFKHALTHEVAYSGLLQERRRALHAQIVDAIERLSPDHVADQVERLGHHAVCGERWDKAVAYCRQAGEKALARSAHREAVAYFEQALSALTHLPEQCVSREQAIDLRLALRSALQPLGALERVLTLLREAESLATGLDDPSRRGQVARALSNHFYLRGAPDQAITAGQHALALGTASGDVVLQALANLGLGYAYHAQGAYRLALACLGQSVAALAGTRRHERFGQVILPAVNARVWCAWCQAELGMFTEGAALGEEGLQIAEAIGHPGSLMAASWGLGLLSLHQGDLGRALPRLERAMSLCQDADLPSWFSRIAAALGAAYYLGERIADAMPLLMQAMAQATAAESVYQAQCRLSLGAAQLLADRLADAQALAERALAHAREHQERGHQAYALRLLGNIAAHQNPQEIEPAAHHYRQALALADALGMRPLVAHCHRDLGTLCAQLGKSEQARITLSMAIALYRDMGMTCWLPHAEATLAQIEAHPC